MAKPPKLKKVSMPSMGKPKLSLHDPESALGLRKRGVNRMASVARAGRPRMPRLPK